MADLTGKRSNSRLLLSAFGVANYLQEVYILLQGLLACSEKLDGVDEETPQVK